MSALPPSSSVDSLLTALIERLGPELVLTGSSVTSRAAGIFDPTPIAAKAIVRPRTTEEVAQVLQLCHRAGQTVVAHGGLTNLVGSAATTHADIALSFELMNHVEEVDPVNRTLTAQAGTPLQRVQEAAAAADLFFPLDLAPRGSATVGGTVATNAGGVRVLRYGMMRSLVLGLEVVLADGTLLPGLRKLHKDNTGYDLKGLFIGSEGTLGIVTRAVLRLWPQPHSVQTALLGTAGFAQTLRLFELAERELGAHLASFEVLWNDYYRLTTTPPAPTTPPLAQTHALYVLVETLGDHPQADRAQFDAFLERAQAQALFEDAVVAVTGEARRSLWYIREDSEQLERQHTPIDGFDVSLPIDAMEAYITGIQHALRARFASVRCYVYGHLGDGNLHLNIWTEAGAGGQAAVEEIVYRPLAAVGGSISAEHGIGVAKKAALHLRRTPAEIALMRRIKMALDPHAILNPGKIFD